ncbi:MAG TPA: galactitol-1-phosphate 5-dehydrogenase [Vicinamibacterales bacterium]|nr:galactitol-1-phosphate 5-dehydrogenase [Vicinamibacterales bacterium]
MTMRALLLTEYKTLSITDMPIPEIGSDEVLVRVRACGICGSDVHGYDGSTGRRIPPLVMGHEAAGVIERTGSAVDDYHAGDRVTFDSTVSCGTCDFCRRGEINLCDNRMVLGVSCGDYRRHGAFAEFVSVPARILYRLPDSLPFERAALIEAVSIAVHAVGRHVPRPDDAVVVVGAGMIGVLVIQVLREKGCRNIIAVEIDAEKRALAERMGAGRTLNPTETDIPTTVRELTGGKGADASFEVVGRTETVLAAIQSLRKGGTAVLIGNLSPRVELPLQEVVTRELSLLGSCASSGEYPTCIDLLARGRIDVQPLISLLAPLEEGPSLFARLHEGDKRLMKVVLQP